jgi:4-hydroxymandelate oxidase
VLHPDGELATAQGAGAAGALWVLSTGTTTPLEEIARVARGPLWFQLFLQADRGFTGELVALAERIGCRALMLTVDTPVLGARDRQLKAKFTLPAGLAVPYLHDVNSGRRTLLTQRRVAATWRDVDWLRSITQLPVLLKGIMSGDDAARAVDAGVSGIVVSNHGARNLDTLPATVEVLPEVVQQVNGRIPVLVDGGIRRGTDVVKAIALGANTVGLGRLACLGLAAAGVPGLVRALELLEEEARTCLGLLGVTSYAELGPQHLAAASPVNAPDTFSAFPLL